MTQREGRILRQGNTNKEVFIYRYITEGSFDAYSWQLLETKQRFISSLLSGHLSERDGSDVSEIVLNYAEIKAIAIGNPEIKKRVEAANELDKLLILKREQIKLHESLAQELNTIPTKINNQAELISKAKADFVAIKSLPSEFKVDYLVDISEALTKLSQISRDEDSTTEESADNEIATLVIDVDEAIPQDSATLVLANEVSEKETRTDKKERIAKEKRILRCVLEHELSNGALQSEEKDILTYRGFTVSIPCGMRAEAPYVWLKRDGKYFVELGSSNLGYIVRIDNFIDNFTKHIEKLEGGLEMLISRKEHIEITLNEPDIYSSKIDKLKETIRKIDKKLGVNDKK